VLQWSNLPNLELYSYKVDYLLSKLHV